MKSTEKHIAECCECCGEGLRVSRVRVYRYRRKRHLLFQRVPALVCPCCGHRVFEAAAVEAMEHHLNSPTSTKRRAELLIVSS